MSQHAHKLDTNSWARLDFTPFASILTLIILISTRIHKHDTKHLFLSPGVSREGRAGRTGSAKKGEAILMLDDREFAGQRHRLLTEALPSVRSCLSDVRGCEEG